MAVLRLVPFGLLAACYSPDIRDCTVACTQASDCAPSQTCGDDGFCAGASAAGTCASIAGPVDGGVDSPKPPTDAPNVPADAPPQTVRLMVRVVGRGVVTVPTIGACDAGSGGMECFYDVPEGVPLTLYASPKNHWRFDRWDDACKDAPTETCVLTPQQDTDVRAIFEMLDDDDD